MRVLIVNQFFWPDVAPTGQYLSDLARHLAVQGHDVTVICSKVAYGQTENDGQAAPPVQVIRLGGVAFQRSAVARLLSYFTFITGALGKALSVPKPDLILTMTTPPLLSVLGEIVKRVRGSRHFIWEMDVFPDALVTTGSLSAKSPIVRLLSSVQRWTRRNADGIIALGPCMGHRLVADGTPVHLVHVAENWADSRVIAPLQPSNQGAFHILYSGNLGRAHDVGTIADAIRYLRNNSSFLFSFSGGGVGRDRLRQLCHSERIRNAKFLPYANRADMSEHLAQADIGLVTQLNACLGTVVPSKVYGLMAAGRPFLFIGPREATPSLIIQRFDCGWQIDPGDSPALIALLDRLSLQRDEVLAKGQRALATFRRFYDLPFGVNRVAAALGLGDGLAEPIEESFPKLAAGHASNLNPNLSVVQ